MPVPFPRGCSCLSPLFIILPLTFRRLPPKPLSFDHQGEWGFSSGGLLLACGLDDVFLSFQGCSLSSAPSPFPKLVRNRRFLCEVLFPPCFLTDHAHQISKYLGPSLSFLGSGQRLPSLLFFSATVGASGFLFSFDLLIDFLRFLGLLFSLVVSARLFSSSSLPLCRFFRSTGISFIVFGGGGGGVGVPIIFSGSQPPADLFSP